MYEGVRGKKVFAHATVKWCVKIRNSRTNFFTWAQFNVFSGCKPPPGGKGILRKLRLCVCITEFKTVSATPHFGVFSH